MHRQKPQLKWKCHTHMFYKDTVHSNGFIYWNQVMLLWLCFSGNLHLACYAVLFCISLKLYLGLRMFRYFSGQEDKNTGNENDFYWWNIHLFVNRGHSPPVFLVSSNKGGSIMYGWCYMQIMSCIVKRHCWKEAGWRTTHVHAHRLEQNGNFSYIVMLDFFFFFLAEKSQWRRDGTNITLTNRLILLLQQQQMTTMVLYIVSLFLIKIVK